MCVKYLSRGSYWIAILVNLVPTLWRALGILLLCSSLSWWSFAHEGQLSSHSRMMIRGPQRYDCCPPQLGTRGRPFRWRGRAGGSQQAKPSHLTCKKMAAQRAKLLAQGHSANCWQVTLPF